MTKNTNFDKANVLKIIILPSRIRFLRHHILKTFSKLVVVFLKFCSTTIFFLYEKKYPSIYIASLVKSIHLIPQTATSTPFISPIPAALHFGKFGLKPENDENQGIAFSNSFVEPTFFKKKVVVSSA